MVNFLKYPIVKKYIEIVETTDDFNSLINNLEYFILAIFISNMNNGQIPKLIQVIFVAILVFPFRIFKIYGKYNKECKCNDIELCRIFVDSIIHSILYSIIFYISRILISTFVGQLFGDIVACQLAIILESYISPKIYDKLYNNNYCHACLNIPTPLNKH